ncbi:MAG: hypothetical protein CL696_10300 [Chloroflexi bacterium]|nr:hypothetical protein [Chloroflexota bacterium]
MLVGLYLGDDGQSNFPDLKIDAWPEQWDLDLTNARIDFPRRGESGNPFFSDCHPEPRRQNLIPLTGQMEVTVGDGTSIVLNPGDVPLAEDLTGQGHQVRSLGDHPYSRVTIPLE